MINSFIINGTVYYVELSNNTRVILASPGKRAEGYEHDTKDQALETYRSIRDTLQYVVNGLKE